MLKCEHCTFYTKPLFRRPRCLRIRNVNFLTKRDDPVSLEFGQKVCKGYFFEPNTKYVHSKEWQEMARQVFSGALKKGSVDQGEGAREEEKEDPVH